MTRPSLIITEARLWTGVPPRRGRNGWEPDGQRAISWNSNDIHGVETARVRCAENLKTGVMRRRSERWLPVGWRPARLATILEARTGPD